MTKLRVIVPVADMRSEPDNRSERTSQQPYGYVVEPLGDSGQFLRVRSEDGYKGWILRDYLQATDASQPDYVTIVSPYAAFRLLDSGQQMILPFSARVTLLRDYVEYHEWGSGGTMEHCSGTISPDEPVDFDKAISHALSLISVPYLWGGRSGFGFDCSGFVQAVYRTMGLILPRDSKEQALCGREVEWSVVAPGDLIFLPDHVAIHLGKREILHATRKRGMVCVESLDPTSSRYRGDLAESISTIRRVIS